MNLLIDNWIPVSLNGEAQRISLKQLLCDKQKQDWHLAVLRDDMDLAALQLLVCLVQVVLMPEDAKALKKRWSEPMPELEYEQAIQPFISWFDLLHAETPFMQSATVTPEKGNKNWASLQKLFIGLPEKTSTSASSNGFFNTPDEIQAVHLGDAAIALFQQATNGFSLGGAAFSVGLKGSMPLTTLVLSENLRKTIWTNVLSKAFLQEKAPELLSAEIRQPTWVIQPHTDKQEHALQIGLLRGLFWQPAKIKLEVKNDLATGFFKNAGMCSVPGFWQHPHTPIDILRLHTGNAKEKPFLSARNDLPLWGQMLCFFYTNKQLKIVDAQQEGTSCALVVQQYQDNSTWRGRNIKLAVGGYVKGGSAESLAGRKHETYSLSTNWENKSAEMDHLIKMGLEVYKKLDWAMNEFARIAIDKGKHKGKESGFKKAVKGKAKQAYFENSESMMHSILRKLAWEDIASYQKQFAALARKIFEQIMEPYEHEPKMLQAIIESRALLNNRLNKMGAVHD
ncbi:type I-E CRISPR-associated protein Cse1/CasA [Methylotuvimicrobium alcaliphilum]|uniref:CRISPR-associated protein, Cse1 family n=1 Tax=Methylotuvimicrobium alcaliphilum (strain DSM 19304 / NCIMB 14124 / VKM B-2133 / 20Z) TaxID=1091494 RepID=G4SY67_META2|nr:type I-E CRISPR-associated protein Cse1/CasA [Methylotuvimicrobium alcaliphilum]CCE25376.1 CRISPR-associated protein, Cse1 family [Methylotuvimicrobium alcaliphilum 20Z]